MKSKIGALLFSGVFALAFCAGGFFGGLLPLAKMLRASSNAHDYLPVAAQVLDVRLESGAKGTKGVRARYRYQFGGQMYESSRVGLLDGGKDNVGDWHGQWHARLQNAKRKGLTVTAWVDPERPQDAVLDRNLRWGLLILVLVFATLFPAIGLVATWVFIKVLRSPADAEAVTTRDADAPDSWQAAVRARRAASGPDWSDAGKSARLASVPIPAKSMQVAENDGEWSAVFPNMAARLAGVFWLFPSAGAFSMARQSFPGHGAADAAWTIAWLLAACANAGLSLHYFTRTWKLVVTRSGIERRRDSLLRPGRMHVVNEDIVEFVKKVCGKVESDTYARCYFQIYVRTRDDKRVQLTPGIEGENIADAVAYRLNAGRGGHMQMLSPLSAEPFPAIARWFLGILVAASLSLIIAGAVGLHAGYQPGEPVDVSRIVQDWATRLERLGFDLGATEAPKT